ncbi:SusC/RagA family TonB-linked outer membrane protein [Filimonas effusa]|uniref:SusC/RagA family TonB-linked outer membrane protein n=1 Tax=Filimonas effusa TaxID=2508721 RepID=A0A4Q1D5B3_9BACT|nr:SusC/RagA family TonB-linked outer membrane protein [Filimonas effusa]RXK83680.1 SusC/RagA family TonB-linked outer membrane protein [Filimonas effusa]
MSRRLLVFLLLLAASFTGFGQDQTTVTGQVLSEENGKPVPGASVFVDNSPIGEQAGPDVIQNAVIGAVTDVNGRFTLKVPAGTAYLKVSSMGYNTILVNILNKKNISIRLASEKNNLSEVIVNGYTNIAKRKNTTATAKIEIDKIRQTGVSGVDQMLEGQIAGVSVTTLNGGPNGAPQIRIRGNASLTAQDPLWVLDGIPLEGTNMPVIYDKDNIDQLRNLPIAGINPDDIADITILKDAAATAIYGARASNGVIVITTKKGKKGPVAISFSANTFIAERPNFNKLNLMNAAEKVDFELGVAANPELTYRPNQGAVTRILNNAGELGTFRTNGFAGLSSATQQAINALKLTNTDWGKEIYQTPANQQYGLNLSGGNDQANYYFSAGYYDERGTTIGTGLKRYNITLKTDVNISSKLSFGAALFASKSDRKSYLTEVDAFTSPSRYSRNVNPYLSVKDANGNYIYDQDIQGTGNLTGDVYIPFNITEERDNTKYKLSNGSLKGLFNVNYKILPGLKLRSELGLQFEEISAEKFAGTNSYFLRKLKESTRYYNSATRQYEYFLPAGGTIQNQNTSFFQYNWKNVLEFNKVINQKHEIDVMVGSELRRNKNTDLQTKGFGYNEKTLTNQTIVFPNSDFASYSSFRPYQKTFAENAFASAYATVSYTYDRKYTAYGSIRYDGSDLFGVDPKYKYLPIYSISGAWNVREEDFLRSASAISNLRIRASYGLQGNIDKYTSPFIVGSYEPINVLPGNNETGVNVTTPPNNKLRWEKTATVNVGFDLGLFNNRIQVIADYYNRNGKDLIGTEMLQLENGFNNTKSNFARINNKGIELSISTHNIVTKNFQWSTDFNIARNKSRMIRQKAAPSDFMPSKEGYPINALFVLKTAGLDANGIPQFLQNGRVTSLEDFYQLYDPYADIFPGELLDTRLDRAGFQSLFSYAGDMDPKFTGGLINRFRLGGFDLAISALFKLDQWKLAAPSYNPAAVDRGQNYARSVSSLPPAFGKESYNGERWMAYTWMNSQDPINSYRMLDIFAKKISYVRINSIRLGYNLPASVARKVKAGNIKLTVESRNPFVFGTNYDGYFDPETYGDIYAQPVTRSISFGLNATF